jgi:hypothetical protein
VELVENRVDEGDDEPPQLLPGTQVRAVDLAEQREQAIERVLVTGEEDFLLVAARRRSARPWRRGSRAS